jgi:SpoIID/LytB domain protein
MGTVHPVDPGYMRPCAPSPRRRARPRARPLAAALLALAAPLAAGAPTAAAPTTSAETLLIRGAGDGHGVGMSQEGALGYAQHGYGYTQILAHYYTGTAIGRIPEDTSVRVMMGGHVKRMNIETYVRGVVGAEMPGDWPAAALQAQAVASRTYALTDHAGGTRFDVYSDTRSQVYLGARAQTAATNSAVAATAGQIVTYEGQPAITYFFASSGGTTEDVQNGFPGAAPEPWLVGVPDPYDQGPLHTWSLRMSFAAAARRLRGLYRGELRGVEVLRRGYSPRILTAEVLGSRGDGEVTGAELESRLGLYSTWAYFSVATPAGVQAGPEAGRTPAPTPTPGEPTGGGTGAAT